MTVSEKIKTIDNKMEQNKTQYNLDRQTVTKRSKNGTQKNYGFDEVF